MYRARYCRGWGSRLPRSYVDLFFSAEPTQDDIIDAFKTEGVNMNSTWFEPQNSGLVTVQEIIPVW